ncbi:MAG TPA: crossover junction endodeoxyribonuclease RuvC [Candidatus Peribacteraceae bacterium]|nr:crossover junction endodeoxyribonuclease RuvC [Candidatus Peribacteraceae bacterium]
MVILGIDPGIAITGIGLLESADRSDLRVRDWCVIETAAGLPLAERLAELATDIRQIITEHQPELAVLERLFFTRNQASAIEVAHARGVIAAALAEHGIAVCDVTPRQLKLAITGDGNADKRQMQDMLIRMLRLAEIPTPDDAADALAMAAYGALRFHPAAAGFNPADRVA